MSSDFYFKKWIKTLANLEALINFDTEYQDTKVHDPTECEAAQRLTGMLGRYIAVYNDAIECFQQNLQVQKTQYMKQIVKATASRIIELKDELQKLEDSVFQFFGNGLIENLITIDDVELNEIPNKLIRRPDTQAKINKALQKAKEKIEALANPETKEEIPQTVVNWWEDDRLDEYEKDLNEEEKEKIPEVIRKSREMIVLIQAHEKLRQTITLLTHKKQKRDLWTKELTGTLQAPEKYELRERSATIIQKVLRVFFKSKREKVKQCKRDELLGINLCKAPNKNHKRKLEEILNSRFGLHGFYEMDWNEQHEKTKEKFLKRNRDGIIEDYRDQIRDWCLDWFERVQYIHDLPKHGSTAIFKGDFPGPEEWIDKYKKFEMDKHANKTKSVQQKKFDRMVTKRELMRLKREENFRKKAKEAMLKKIMKNPTMHPGYYYPQSERIDHIRQVIKEYHRIWDQYDEEETVYVKQKFMKEIDIEDCLMEAKLAVLPTVHEQMKEELHILKISLKEDYLRNGMKMPKIIKQSKFRKTKKTIKLNDLFNQETINDIEELYAKGIIREYPNTKIEDYIGDANFVGEDLRCNLKLSLPFNGEVRAYWWEKCRDVIHGFQKILLVGPSGGGKTKLVHTLASVNNAILFELDPIGIKGEFLSAVYLRRLIQSVVACARAVQPSVIHIRHVEKMFYVKVPREEVEMRLDLIKIFFIQKLFKRIQKSDNITVIAYSTIVRISVYLNSASQLIVGGVTANQNLKVKHLSVKMSEVDKILHQSGSCENPCVAKSKPLLKHFPRVLLLPNTTYSVMFQILKEWVLKYNVIPADFNISNLAYVLQGYSFRYVQQALERFMIADRIVQIAAFGLNPEHVSNFILDDDLETKAAYDKYLKWYIEKTDAGIRDVKHLEERREFKQAMAKYMEKIKKKNVIASNARSRSGLL